MIKAGPAHQPGINLVSINSKLAEGASEEDNSHAKYALKTFPQGAHS